MSSLDLTDPRTFLWAAAGALFVIAAISAVAEHRRTRRRHLDRVGWVPWNLIQVLAFMASVVALALAIKAG
jgi:hypothetical protein